MAAVVVDEEAAAPAAATASSAASTSAATAASACLAYGTAESALWAVASSVAAVSICFLAEAYGFAQPEIYGELRWPRA